MTTFVKLGFPVGPDNRPASTATRIIIPVSTVRMGLSKSKVIDDHLIQNIPDAIAAKGMKPEEWTTAMTEFKAVISNNIWSVLTYIFLGFTVIFIPLIAVIYRRLHTKVAAFMVTFNDRYMIPNGMYAKTQKAVVNGKYRYEFSWIAVALTDAEADKLQSEEHVFYLEDGIATENPGATNCAQSCCCGVIEVI
ncbi:hypothetical protein BDR26DRAFT_861932 [Obelidium mucronatum]|nr:hypothetical protein BDR26DRAFT_861932 [Obelidium mucronatum]